MCRTNDVTLMNKNGQSNFPASWYAICLSKFVSTKPKRLTRFGDNWVVWRDRSGNAALMEEHCPHLGASLVQGYVDGNGCLVCPFHKWRFDVSGVCVAIPGSTVIPKEVHRKPLQTMERHGLLWAWWGSADPLFDLPELPQLEDARRGKVTLLKEYRFKTSPSMILANAFDGRHFIETHCAPSASFSGKTLSSGSLATNRSSDAWCGCILKFKPSSSTLIALLKEAIVDRSVSVSRTVLGTVAGWAQARARGVGEFSIQVEGWPSGNCSFVTLGAGDTVAVLVAATPIDSQSSATWSVAVKTHRGGALRQSLNRVALSALLWQLSRVDAPILSAIDLNMNRIFLREDAPMIEYFRLYDRYIERADPDWIAGRNRRPAVGRSLRASKSSAWPR